MRKNLTPSYLSSLMPSPSSTSGYQFRREPYPVPAVSKISSLSSFIPRSIILWNTLPSSVQSAKTVSQFKSLLTPTHNQHKERDSVWRILGGWWQGGWTAPEFELEKVTLRVTEISGGLPPCRTGERRAVYPPPPAGRGNADCNEAVYPPAGWGIAGRFTPCRTGERRYWNVAVYPLPDGGTPGGLPLPDGGTPNAMWWFTPCRTGERRAVYPLPDGGTPGGLPPAGRGNADLECGGLPPAGRGHADLECGGLPPCRTGARRFGLWRFTPVMVMSQPPLPTSSLYYYKVGNMQEDDQDESSNRRMQLRLREREGAATGCS